MELNIRMQRRGRPACLPLRCYSHRDPTTVCHFLRRRIISPSDFPRSIALSARNAACDDHGRSFTQQLIALTAEIVMTTRFFIPALVAVLRSPGRLFLLSLFLILPLFSQAVLAQGSKNNWDDVMKINSGSKLTIKTKN
jgi:hypothetical protein